MDFLNLLIPKEKIVGIEIGNRRLRMLALRKDSFGNISVQGKSEMDLEEGIFESGEIKDIKKLSKALGDLKSAFKPQSALSPFVIVTVSQKSVYCDILKFPKNLTNEQLVEAIGFNAAKVSPLPLSECYLDWQMIGEGKLKNDYLVYIIPKSVVDSYKSALEDNKFKLIALEPSSLSIGRAADISGGSVLFFYLTDEGLTSLIYSDNNPYFSQFEFWPEASDGYPIDDLNGLNEVLERKVEKISRYFENQFARGKINKVLLMSEGFDADNIARKIKTAGVPVEKAKSGISSIDNYDWIPVAGAAKRAFIPRSEDTIISLLPVGTESLYESQKATSFASSILVMMSSIVIFYLSVFAASVLFISYIGTDLNHQVGNRSNLPMPTDYADINQSSQDFNDYVANIKTIMSSAEGDYGSILKKVDALNYNGISLTNIGLNSATGSVSASGVAATRENLNAFKSFVTSSPSFANPSFSVQNIAQKSNIPFTLSFNFK